jgi:hypothetical protein
VVGGPPGRVAAVSAPQEASAVDRLVQAKDRLVGQVAHWQPGRWSANERANRVYALVQRLADRAADAESRPHRRVPRLGDLVLPDQLKVVVDDLVAAPGAEHGAAADDVDGIRRAL